MIRRQRRRPNENEKQKSSFNASAPHEILSQERMAIHSAIDDSLCTVRFNAEDARSVISSIHNQRACKSSRKKRRKMKPELLFTGSLLLVLVLPLTLYAIRSTENIKAITHISGPAAMGDAQQTQYSPDSLSPDSPADFTPAASPAAQGAATENAFLFELSESEALRIARQCFEEQCDTGIFSFEEYHAQTKLSEDGRYTITLESIYENGCRFTVVLSAETGEVLQYSAPRLATIPSHVDNASPQIRAWYEQYGAHLFTWPQDVQAEFSRRYQGGTLRAAREGEISYEDAKSAVRTPVEAYAPGLFTAFYPVLYSERAASNGRAFYLVYCYTDDTEEAFENSEPMMVSFDALTGDIINIEGNPLGNALSLKNLKNTKEEESDHEQSAH